MQLTAYEMALIGGGFTVIGVLLGGWITYRFALNLAKTNTRREAGAKLRAAFAPSLAFIYLAKKHGSTHEVPNVDVFLKKVLPDLAAEIEIFRQFIPKSEGAAYQEAWERYRYEVWNYGFDATTLRPDIGDPEKVFEDLIYDILQFTKMKGERK